MKTTHIILLCILGAVLLSAVNCNTTVGPVNCCFNLCPRRIKKSGLILLVTGQFWTSCNFTHDDIL
uniref:Chemokine interleukin-8-like domain-containing protein n=1 Tax=Oreochromis niloticus TaxID=8128 RepID=A0A669CA70_ORENI